MKPVLKRLVAAAAVICAVLLLWRTSRPSGADSARPTRPPHRTELSESGVRVLSMAEVLEMATAARAHMSETLDDYTARFVKQEVDTSGVLGEETEILMRVQTRLRGDHENAPMRVYLKFVAPESIKGREVLWGEDLHGGKMAVHEVGFLLGLKTIWLDPNGMLAMQGQRYPISEIGMVNLVEKLIERGQQDLDNPEVEVTLTPGHLVGETPSELIRVRRKRPSNDENDFSLAEIAIDPERQLILSYRSFGWPSQPEDAPPLLESYTYYDVKTNVGLTDSDFQTTNPEYGFPSL